MIAKIGPQIPYAVLAEIAQFFNLDYNDLIEVVDDFEKENPQFSAAEAVIPEGMVLVPIDALIYAAPQPKGHNE